jgi:D-amino peptidase
MPLLGFSEREAHATGGRVLLMFDMEGVTGATKVGEYDFGNPAYPLVQQSLVDDVSAAVRGLVNAGVSEIVMQDAHASGNTQGPDFPLNKLPKGVRFDIRDAPYDPYIDGVEPGYDAIALVGYHARGGSDSGFVPHTYFGVPLWKLDGLMMSEDSMIAFSGARYNIPMILTTGDDVHQVQTAEWTNAESVVVKKAISPAEAEPRSRDVVSAEIEAAAERAYKNRAQIKIRRFGPRLESEWIFPLAELTAMATAYPGVQIVDDRTLRLESTSYQDALLAFRSISNFMRYAEAYLTVQAIRKLPAGADMIQGIAAKLPVRSYQPTSKALAIDNKLSRWGYA